MKIDNRKVYYELNPKTFYDSNNSGIGDYKGIEKKSDYFNYLGVNTLIFPSIFENYGDLKKEKFINAHFGSAKDFLDISRKMNAKDLDVYMIFDFDQVENYRQWYENYRLISRDGELKTISEIDYTLSYFVDKEQTGDLNSEWFSTERMQTFEALINFYLKLDVNGIIFQNFEKLTNGKKQNDSQIYTKETEHVLNKLIRKIKAKSPKTSAVGRVSEKAIIKKKHLNEFLSKISFDNYIFDLVSSDLVNEKHPYSILERNNERKMMKIFRTLSKINLSGAIQLNNLKFGRIMPRLVAESDLFDKFSKLLIMFQSINTKDVHIFQGDELGLANIKFNSSEEFYDPYYNETKRELGSKNIKEETFFRDKSLLSPMNMDNVFPWNDEENVGFTNNKNLYFKKVINYKTNNVETSFKNENSVLNFYKEILRKKKMFLNVDSKFIEYKYSFDLEAMKIYKLKIKTQTNTYYLYLNFSDSSKRISIKKEHEILFTNYFRKRYDKEIRMLEPFEGIFLKIK